MKKTLLIIVAIIVVIAIAVEAYLLVSTSTTKVEFEGNQCLAIGFIAKGKEAEFSEKYLKNSDAPNLVPTLVMILGFLLVGMAAISIGMFISSLTENQIISAVVTIVFFVSSWFLPNLNDNFSIIDLMSNYQKFPAGLISMSEVVNLLGITVVFILFTIIIMQRKKSIK